MSRNMHHLITILLLLMPAQSATTGALRGTVLDPAGAVVPGATVTLVNPATGQTQTTMTDTKGLYGFSLLSPEGTQAAPLARADVGMSKSGVRGRPEEPSGRFWGISRTVPESSRHIVTVRDSGAAGSETLAADGRK